MRALLFVLVAAAIGGAVGWAIGTAMLPPGAELETAIYPVSGAIVGALVALIVGIGTVKAARSSRGRHDL